VLVVLELVVVDVVLLLPATVVVVTGGFVVDVVLDSTLVVDVVLEVTTVVEVEVLGAGHRQLSLHVVPPAQAVAPGGSQSSPADTIPSPHWTSQDVPLASQQLRHVDESAVQVASVRGSKECGPRRALR
jgi:hypothetical protein